MDGSYRGRKFLRVALELEFEDDPMPRREADKDEWVESLREGRSGAGVSDSNK